MFKYLKSIAKSLEKMLVLDEETNQRNKEICEKSMISNEKVEQFNEAMLDWTNKVDINHINRTLKTLSDNDNAFYNRLIKIEETLAITYNDKGEINENN